MTTDPWYYNEAWPTDRALQFINDNSASHFDPDLVRISMIYSAKF